jgi:hypothetical protein
MTIAIVLGVLIGVPALFGAQMVVRRESDRERRGGGMLLFFALAMTAAYVFALPEGRIVRANYDLLAPLTLVGGVVCGAVWAILARRRG